ncbi:MAG: hypothetical protein QM751_07605 [Paludibacteraceae bacterium]
MDADYAANQRDDHPVRFEHSLFILTTVMSLGGDDWFVVDAGLKSFSGESGMPLVHNRPGMTVTGLSDEHSKIDLAPGTPKPKLGEKLLLIPGHSRSDHQPARRIRLPSRRQGRNGLADRGARRESIAAASGVPRSCTQGRAAEVIVARARP